MDDLSDWATLSVVRISFLMQKNLEVISSLFVFCLSSLWRNLLRKFLQKFQLFLFYWYHLYAICESMQWKWLGTAYPIDWGKNLHANGKNIEINSVWKLSNIYLLLKYGTIRRNLFLRFWDESNFMWELSVEFHSIEWFFFSAFSASRT